jgi:hypothetical protein
MLEFLGERLKVLARLATQIITDAVLFVLWLGIDWIMQVSADFFSRHGLHESFAFGFKWVSSSSIFVMTLLYVVRDIKNAWAALVSPPDAH